jgi:hypothetical protein
MSRGPYVTSMLSPLMSRTRSTTASTFRTLDARDANRDELLPVTGGLKSQSYATERLCIA